MALATFQVRQGPSGPKETLTVPDLPNGYVTTAMLQDESVSSGKLQSGAVTPDKMGTGFAESIQYSKADSGLSILLPFQNHDRVVQIAVEVTETFANGDGAQATYKIGQSGNPADVDKFAVAADFTNATASKKCLVFAGVLSAGVALIVTRTAATGTATGEIRASVQALRK